MPKNNIPVTLLPLDKFHIIPLDGLAPESLKRSSKKAMHDREAIPHTTKLNAISKKLGFLGGFAFYEQEYKNELLPFMARNNLNIRVNLLEHSIPGNYNPCKSFTHQQVSERLFFTDQKLPQKLFTGHNFDFSRTFDWHNMDIQELVSRDKDLYHVICRNDHVKREANDDFSFVKLSQKQQEFLNLDIFTELKPIISGKKRTVRIIDLILLQNRMEGYVTAVYHLLGNNLTDLTDELPEMQLYNSGNNEGFKVVSDEALYVKKLLNILFQKGEEGWVNVIPFNDHLIFLSDGKGNYDFVIKNQRDRKFEHQIYGEYLKRADMPSCIDTYRFKRWFYFEYQGNRDLDSHESEKLFYEKGNLSANYPGTEEILRQYYETKGIYIPHLKNSSEILKGFQEVSVAGKKLMVSELKTIDDLYYFLASNQDFARSRKGDAIKPVNSDEDRALPASLSYYDVLAYINWQENETGVPLRLLKADEYLDLREGGYSRGFSYEERSDLRFYDLKGNMYDGSPDYMDDKIFDALPVKYPVNFVSFSYKALSFVDSNYFAEWLHEGTSIRSASLTSFYGDKHILRSSGPLYSTGKYKYLKTGFRLCYELTHH
ncbi:hypothetical protein [Shewanella sp. 10N.286.52.B9]|uniref:hypothetical protein n=1 Tax=Shewanella sp. 10N.286.52.B9 TaxID=1880837 RepID=UPI000C86205E|nr:hypothetical protein [Shewanella sp. 10N.286.52.B9]PMG50694.1 hypothetical protein BCU91_17240 [Shewanella sp. 10N.286.52.B9]